MMKYSIVIKGIHLSANCGFTKTERDIKQPILVDLRMRCDKYSSFHSDRLDDTIDYGAVVRRVRDIGEGTRVSLIETLINQICQTLFLEFPVTRLEIWARKIQPPLPHVQGSVGVHVVHTRSGQPPAGGCHFEPSPFLVRQLPILPRGKALDVAAGKGRNSLFLAAQGYSVHAVDRDEAALNQLLLQAEQSGCSLISTEKLDLEDSLSGPPELGQDTYDLILVFFYLYRPLFPRLMHAVKPGGMILYETFLIDNHLLYQHPRRKEFCLQPNELLQLLSGWRILHYEEGTHGASSGKDSAITARIVAQKPK